MQPPATHQRVRAFHGSAIRQEKAAQIALARRSLVGNGHRVSIELTITNDRPRSRLR